MASTEEELTAQATPEVWVVELPARPQMASQSVAVPTLRRVDRILQRTGRQTVDIPAPKVLEDEEDEEVLYSQSCLISEPEGGRGLGRVEVAVTLGKL